MSEAAAAIVSEFTIEVEHIHDYEFRVRFDKPQHPELLVDEPAPLGGDRGPNPSRLLAAAIANCLTASLLFCARKSRIETGKMHTRATARITRNPAGRLRVAGVSVEIDPQFTEPDRASRCLGLFQDYCVVTESVRHGIPVEVTVKGLGAAAE